MRDDRQHLQIEWQTELSILSLRGEGAAFAAGVERALGVALPLEANTTQEQGGVRLVWVSPDDCFVISGRGQAAVMEARLRESLKGEHFAVTDVSSGYFTLSLAGAATRTMLAQGCPLDLHPRAFKRGQCAGSHFFKASVWLWQVSHEPRFELLMRRSFAPYVDTMLAKASLDLDVQRRGVAIEAYA